MIPSATSLSVEQFTWLVPSPVLRCRLAAHHAFHRPGPRALPVLAKTVQEAVGIKLGSPSSNAAFEEAFEAFHRVAVDHAIATEIVRLPEVTWGVVLLPQRFVVGRYAG